MIWERRFLTLFYRNVITKEFSMMMEHNGSPHIHSAKCAGSIYLQKYSYRSGLSIEKCVGIVLGYTWRNI